MTKRKKKWKKYVTRNHITSCCIYGENAKEKGLQEGQLGFVLSLFLNFGQNRGSCCYEIVLMKKVYSAYLFIENPLKHMQMAVLHTFFDPGGSIS